MPQSTMHGELERFVSVGRAAYPDIRVAADRVLPFIRARVDGEELATLAMDEVFLACACATADTDAITAFERRYFGVIAPALARMSLSRDEVRDIEQLLRVRLFVANPGDVPRVVAYAGQGQLGALVRVAAVRAALNLLREAGRLERNVDGLEELPVAADDPELARLKAQHRVAFKAAFEAAVASLDKRDRSLLHLAIVKGVGIDRVGAVYGVHRATAARWIAQARGNLSRAVQRRLVDALGIAAGELEDLLPLVESQLELSLERLLQSRVEES